jgi:hypothetical protein
MGKNNGLREVVGPFNEEHAGKNSHLKIKLPQEFELCQVGLEIE